MVYNGRPSAGCENCRKAKKACDQAQPTCDRCLRLGKVCGGYRDLNDLIFRDESESVSRRVGSVAESSTSSTTSVTPQTARDSTAEQFFFTHFVTSTYLTCLEGVTPDAFLKPPILACGYAVMSNRDPQDTAGREAARRHYLEAITAMNLALQHPEWVRRESTLIAIALLSIFEQLTWEGDPPMKSSRQHAKGMATVLQTRGRSQNRTVAGRTLFRQLRGLIMVNALMEETPYPDFLLQWSQALEYDPIWCYADTLNILAARLASLRSQFKTGEGDDQQLAQSCATLEMDLIAWSENTQSSGSICSFRDIPDPESDLSCCGIRHEYRQPRAHHFWNLWRCLRILLSRMQETIWRRSWPSLVQPSQPVRDAEHHRILKSHMVTDICRAVNYALGSDTATALSTGSAAIAIPLINPLTLAGTCLVERLLEPTISPNGSRRIFLQEPLHLDPFNQSSTQLAWIIERLDFIGEKVGVRCASAVSRFLQGETFAHYNLGRSNIIAGEDLEREIVTEMFDLDRMYSIPDLTDL